MNRYNCVGKVLLPSYLIQCPFPPHEDVLHSIHQIMIKFPICGQRHMAQNTLSVLKQLFSACFMAVCEAARCPECHAVCIVCCGIRRSDLFVAYNTCQHLKVCVAAAAYFQHAATMLNHLEIQLPLADKMWYCLVTIFHQ